MFGKRKSDVDKCGYRLALGRVTLCDMKRYNYREKWVLITGASTGIGHCFALELANRGANLILVARNEARLNELKRTLEAQGVSAICLPTDLSEPSAAKKLRDEVEKRGLLVDVLINNAGVGNHGRFEQLTLEEVSQQIQLNVTALTELTHAFLPSLRARRGGIVQVASTAAFQPVPYMAVYAATKAYVLSFGEALYGELLDEQVRVLTLCPGATATPFFDRAGEAAALGEKAAPKTVVTRALRAFDRGVPIVVPGMMNRFRCFLGRLVSRRFMIGESERLMRPR